MVKNGSGSRFQREKTLIWPNRDHITINQNQVYIRWIGKYLIWELKNLKLFSLFFLSYTLQCKLSELELGIIGRMTSQTFFNHQFGISGLNSISKYVEICFSQDGVRFADTLITTEDKNCVSTTVTKELYTNCTEGEDLEDHNCTTTIVDEEHSNCTDVIIPTTRRSRCAHKRGGCHWNAKCFNWGKKCRCKKGFHGDGKKSCKGMFEPKLISNSFYIINDHSMSNWDQTRWREIEFWRSSFLVGSSLFRNTIFYLTEFPGQTLVMSA